MHEIWEGSKNKNYLLLVIVYSLQVGVNTAFGINIDPIFGENGLGFTSSKIALLGVAAVTMGVFSSMVNGALLKRYSRYLLMLRVFCFGTTGLLLTVMVLAPEDLKMIIAVTMIIGAMFLVPTIPIGIAFANEVSHPMNETVSQGFVMMLSQAFGYILS